MVCTMPGLFGRINNVALIGDKRRDAGDLVFNLAFENHPEFAGDFVKMSVVERIVGFRLTAADNVGKRPGVDDESSALEIVCSHHCVEIKEGLVRGVVFSL